LSSFTQRLTKTLRLDSLAKTFGFTAVGCCPRCRLVQPVLYARCKAGCEVEPRRIAAGDEDFFEPIPGALEVIPEDPQRLRYVRIGVGMVGYLIAGALLVRYVLIRERLDLVPYAIAAASIVPIATAVFPRLSRKPPTVSSRLSGRTTMRQLPASSAPSWTGTASKLGKTVERFLTGERCIACQLLAVNGKGEVLVRARRSELFQLRGGGDQLTVVKGALELVGTERTRTAELPEALRKELGLKSVNLDGVEWIEHVIDDGVEITAYGVRVRSQLRELAAYRDQLMDVLESPEGTVVEVGDRPAEPTDHPGRAS
jgi:hypothetical protein